MTESRWTRVVEVFQEAVEQPAGASRSAWLEQRCGDDVTLRRNVQRLLDAHGEPSLESPASLLDSGMLELAPGDTLAHYRVESKIGQGGMGAVYRAFDTRLRRVVALKVLPVLYAASEDRKRRLLREARAASLLNHPNIVMIHEIGSDQDLDFIAMEHVDGVPLTARIGENGMPPAQLRIYALQIADAMATTHAAKVLHRDLKPSNVMVTRDERIKVLDFGLARLMDPEEAGVSQTLTVQGIVRGTPAYMSPEQASGGKLDARSDIFSFGCVLYQMATGRKAFDGGSSAIVMNAIINNPPRRPTELVALPLDLEALILRCLEKDPDLRFQSMEEAKSALEALDPAARAKRTDPAARRQVRRFFLGAGAALLLAAVGWRLSSHSWRPAPAPRQTVKFAITPANLMRGGSGEIDSEVSISRDGERIAYVETNGRQLWVRDVNSEKAKPVAGARGVYQAFWSPDGQWIGYASGEGCGYRSGCELVKVPVAGGTARTIIKMAGSFKRGFWSSDGKTLVFCDSTGMYTVPAEGGAATLIVGHPHIEHPSFLELPGGRRAVLFQALDEAQPGHAVYIQVLGEAQRRLVKVSESTNPYPAWSHTGHVIYVDGPNYNPSIWAVPISLETLRATGSAFRIVESGSAPMLSATGTMVYGDPPPNRIQLTQVDRSGKILAKIGEPRVQNQPLLSHDGRRVVVAVREPRWDLVVHDIERNTAMELTSDARMEFPGSWTRGDQEVLFVTATTQERAILTKAPGSAREPQRWLSGSFRPRDPRWSPDERLLLYTAFSGETKGDLVYRERRGTAELGEETAFLRTPAHEGDAWLSADGRYVAYTSDASGRSEIYLRDFPAGRRQWRISANGGSSPRWRADGRELFYAQGSKLMSVNIRLGPAAVEVGDPVTLFEKQTGGGLQFDAAADGRRFAVLEKLGHDPPLAVHVVQDWFEEFRRSR